MSARVFNPMVMSEMRRMLTAYESNPRPNRSAASSTSSPDTADIARVRRDLFGPVDHEDNRRFVDRELAAQQTRDADRWGFDFVRESPRKTGPGTGRYAWEKVVPSEPVPEPYALRRLPYLQGATAGEELAVEAKVTEGGDAEVSVTGQEVAEEIAVKPPAAKQARITDYMQVRKRPYPASKSAATQSKVAKLEDRPHAPHSTPS